MHTSRTNGIFMINGRVNPPLTLWDDNEYLVAQNAHNLIWQNHWNECETLDKEIAALKKEGRDFSAPNAKLGEIFAIVVKEQNELITKQVLAFRESRTKNPFADILSRIESLERKMREIESYEIDDIESRSNEAVDLAEEVRGSVESLEERIEAIEEKLSDGK